jgi:hypothetical protein
MLRPTKILALLCSILAPVACVADVEDDTPGSDRAFQTELDREIEDLEVEGPSERDAQDHRAAAAYVADATCAPEVHVGEGTDWLMDMTVEELLTAPSGYLSVAPLRSSNDDPSDCHAEGIVTVRVAKGIAPHIKISSLCVGEQAGDDSIVLEACEDGEATLADWGMPSLTSQGDPTATECWFCTADSCFNNGAYDQKKKGNINPCPFNWGTNCCWATNNGCCY